MWKIDLSDCVFKGYVANANEEFIDSCLKSRKQQSKKKQLLILESEFGWHALTFILCFLAKHFISMDLYFTPL